jgi:syntaxin-binding protein 5
VGGPDRPVPEKQSAAAEWLSTATSPGTAAADSSSGLQAATSGVGDLYNRLGAAISERGQMLDGLQESVGSLQQGSKNMLTQVCPFSLSPFKLMFVKAGLC